MLEASAGWEQLRAFPPEVKGQSGLQQAQSFRRGSLEGSRARDSGRGRLLLTLYHVLSAETWQ